MLWTGCHIVDVTQVEVQEVFEIDDLRSNWYETFQAKKYYVWVPNEKKRKENGRQQAQTGYVDSNRIGTILSHVPKRPVHTARPISCFRFLFSFRSYGLYVISRRCSYCF